MRFFQDSFIIFRRQLRINLRNPAWIMIGVMQPVLYLLLFLWLLIAGPGRASLDHWLAHRFAARPFATGS